MSGIVLITGASSGIGEALAHRYARAGHSLVLVARSADKLRVLANALSTTHGVKAWVASADLSLPGEAHRLALAMKRAPRTIDVLVNSAGVLEHGAFADQAAERHQQLIALNIAGLTGSAARWCGR